MNWLDLVIIIILGVLAYSGYKQGIIKSVLSVAIFALSFLVASVVSPLICDKLISNEDFMASFTSIIEEKLNLEEYLDKNIEMKSESGQKKDSLSIEDSLKNEEIAGGSETISKNQIDEILGKIEKEFHIPSSVMKKVKKELSELKTTNIKGQIVTQVSDVIAGAVARMIIKALCFSVLYFLLFFSLRIAAKVLNLISRFPVVKEVNKLAGAGLGLIEGIFIFWIVGTLLFSLVNAFGWEELGEAMKGSLFMSIL